MSTVFFDYETRSGADLPKVGKRLYLQDAQADIVCLGYQVDDEPVKLWIPGAPVPQVFKKPLEHTFLAYNSEFDRAVTNILGVRYGMGILPLKNTIDLMAVCGRFSFPQSLDKAGDALQLDTRKDRRGKALMKKICMPPFKYTAQELKDFYKYCIQDVKTLVALTRALPAEQLNDTERQIWEHTQRINLRGMPIDLTAVLRIQEVVKFYTNRQNKRLEKITNGAVERATQRDRILKYLQGLDVELPNLQQGTVKDALTQFEGRDEHVHEVLKIRSELGGSAVKKYQRLQDMVVPGKSRGRLLDTLRYCGALHTGRDSGMGFQLQNLPRASVDDVAKTIAKFYDTTILKEPDPMYAAKALIRSMIRARPGHQILAADFSSVEYVMLMWFCGEVEKLQKFREGICPYKTFGASLFGKPYETITKRERQDSKPGILGGGYCLSGRTLVSYAADMGVIIESVERGNNIIKLYRGDHPRVETTWDLLTDASVKAVQYEGEEFFARSASYQCMKDRTGRRWLLCKLPSNRYLYYADPTIGNSYGREVVEFMGVNSYTKKWSPHLLRASVAINNVIQGISRDIMMEKSLELESHKFNIIGRVHDEIICEEKIGSLQTLGLMIDIMSYPPDWCKDAPIKAEGFADERYRKD